MVDHIDIGRIGFAGGQKRSHQVVKRACDLASGGLYKSPSSSDTIDASKPLTITWDTTCPITSTNIDIYLYQPAGSSGYIHGWSAVPFSAGQYQVTLAPKWWGSTPNATLQWNILEAGLESWMSSSAAGPVFKVTYPADKLSALTSTSVSSGAAAAATSAEPEFQQYTVPKPSGLPAGSLAAAIVVPVIAVLIAIGIYVRFARLKEAEKRKRWSAHVDRRMSTISGDWRSQSVHGSIAPGGGRPSMSENRQTRASSYMGRTSSTYAVENNMAGAGAGNRTRVRAEGSAPEMRQVNGGDGSRGSLFAPDRVSRVSFADARTSRVSFGDALRPTMSNLSGITKHQASKSATNLTTPERQRSSILNRHSSAIDDSDDVASLSPSQVSGPFSYGDKDVKGLGGKGKSGKKIARKSVGDWEARASAEDFRNAENARSSVDQLRDMEAVMLMRRSKAMSQYSVPEEPSPAPINSAFASPSATDTDRIEELTLPTQPAAAMRPTSPMGMPLPSASLSPDEMLAAYAAARRNGPVGSSIDAASATPSLAPATSPSHLRPDSVISNNPFRASMVSQTGASEASDYSTEGKTQ